MHKSKIIFVLRNQKQVKIETQVLLSCSFFKTYPQYLSSSCSFDIDDKEGQKNNLIQI